MNAHHLASRKLACTAHASHSSQQTNGVAEGGGREMEEG